MAAFHVTHECVFSLLAKNEKKIKSELRVCSLPEQKTPKEKSASLNISTLFVLNYAHKMSEKLLFGQIGNKLFSISLSHIPCS